MSKDSKLYCQETESSLQDVLELLQLFWTHRSCDTLVTCQRWIEVWWSKRVHMRSHQSSAFGLGDFSARRCENPDTDSSTPWSNVMSAEMWRTPASMCCHSPISGVFLCYGIPNVKSVRRLSLIQFKFPTATNVFREVSVAPSLCYDIAGFFTFGRK